MVTTGLHLGFGKALGFGEPDDFVFFAALSKDRGYAFQTMRLQVNYVLEKAGLKMSDDGQPRTLYSLRHTAIMVSLIDGSELDLFTLAQNCRTSEGMIQRFYGKHLQAEMNIDKLHRRKPTGSVADIIHKMNETGEYWGWASCAPRMLHAASQIQDSSDLSLVLTILPA